MRQQIARGMALAISLTAGCGDKEEATITECGEPCALTNANQFSYQSELSCRQVSAEPLSNTCLDWSALGTDLQGHAFESSPGITRIRMVVFRNMEWEEFLTGLVSDQLPNSVVALYMTCEPEAGSTQCCLDDFGLLGSKPLISQYFEEDSGRWLFVLDTEGIHGARTLACVEPVAGSANELVTIDDESAALDLQVDLQSAAPVVLSSGPDLTLDWTALSVDGLGYELPHQKVDLIQVASYDEDLATLEENFIDLPVLATQIWSADVNGKDSLNLTELEGEEPFPGIDSDHTWLMVLWCSTCENPIPKAIVVLEASE